MKTTRRNILLSALCCINTSMANAQSFWANYTTEWQWDMNKGTNWVNLLRLEMSVPLWKGGSLEAATLHVAKTGDGIIDDKDITPTGFSNVPRFAFSSNLSFGYKGFEISALLTGSAQGTFNMNGYLITPFAQGNGTPLSYMNGRWTPERHAAGKQITFPRMSVNMANSQNNQNNSFWFRSTDHIKLKNVEVAYTFRNARWMRKAHIGSIRVFVNANNLCTWGGKDLVDGIDPELVQDGSTSEGIIYPLTRVYNFGFNIQF